MSTTSIRRHLRFIINMTIIKFYPYAQIGHKTQANLMLLNSPHRKQTLNVKYLVLRFRASMQHMKTSLSTLILLQTINKQTKHLLSSRKLNGLIALQEQWLSCSLSSIQFLMNSQTSK